MQIYTNIHIYDKKRENANVAKCLQLVKVLYEYYFMIFTAFSSFKIFQINIEKIWHTATGMQNNYIQDNYSN